MQTRVILRIMATTFYVLLFCVNVVVVKGGGASKSTEKFLQEVSFRSVYADYDPSGEGDTSVPVVWEKLPFGKLIAGKNSLVSMYPEKNCMVAVKDSVIYSTSLKDTAPAKETLENPYTPWTLLDDSIAGSGGNIITKGKGNTLLLATNDNIVQFTFTEDGNNGCSSVSKVEKLVTKSDTSGAWEDASKVQSIAYSPFLESVFVGFSTDDQVLKIDMSSENEDFQYSVLDKMEAGEGAATMLWVEKWRALITASDLAVFMIFYDDSKRQHRLQREWVGALIGWPVTDLAYDFVNDAVWATETEAVHMLTVELEWRRYGYAQMAPMQNVSSTAVSNGVVWVGSDEAGLSRMWSDTSFQQLDSPMSRGQPEERTVADASTFRDPEGDPWTWQYYYGARYLPSNVVTAVVAAVPYGGDDCSVFVVTDVGIALMSLSPWTLEEKATAFTQFQSPQHDRHGITASCGINYGDRSVYTKNVQDSDGLWTSMHAMGQVYRFIATKEEEARKLAWRAFEGLEMTSILTPAYPSYVARTFCKMDDGTSGCPTSYDDMPGGWYNGSIEGWLYKGDTSSDELAGQLSALPLIYDFIAQTDDEKKRVLVIMEGIVMGIVKNNYFLIDPETGKPTKWGYWAPSWLNDQTEYQSERGTNSVQITGWLAMLYSITGNQMYREEYWKLIREHNYGYNILNSKVDSAVDENHSDTELLMLAFHSMFYSRWRLEHIAVKVEKERYDNVHEMLSHGNCEDGLKRTWLLLKGELNPIWLGIYAGTAALTENLLEEDVIGAAFSLRHWAIDGISWPIDGDQRIDLDIPQDRATFHNRGGTGAVMRYIRPPSERAATENNLDPFVVEGGSGGSTEVEPGIWQLPYYICLANGLL